MHVPCGTPLMGALWRALLGVPTGSPTPHRPCQQGVRDTRSCRRFWRRGQPMMKGRWTPLSCPRCSTLTSAPFPHDGGLRPNRSCCCSVVDCLHSSVDYINGVDCFLEICWRDVSLICSPTPSNLLLSLVWSMAEWGVLLSKYCFVLLICNAEHLQTRYVGKLQGRSVLSSHLCNYTPSSLKVMDMLEKSVRCTVHIFFPPFSSGTICGLLRQTDKFCSSSLKFHFLSF